MRKLSFVIVVSAVGVFSFASCKSHGSCPAYGNSSVKSIQPKASKTSVTKLIDVNYKK
jgi:hypothetical protein